MNKITSIALCALLAGCSNPQPGPDKTLGGAVLGAGWGAGAGAIIGNQTSNPAEGLAVGAGVGAVSGALTGSGYDLAEGVMLEQNRELASLKIRGQANARELDRIQGRLDRAFAAPQPNALYQVYFDPDSTTLRAGTMSNLQLVAESLKQSPRAQKIKIVGHSDDAGTPEYNSRLAEARARAVSAYFAATGIAIDQMTVSGAGSTQPLVSNATPEGRQLNRRVDIYITQ